MILEVARKLRTKLTGNATLVSLTNGIFLNLAPPKQAYPYVTYFVASEIPIHMHQDQIVEDVLWQFSVFSSELMTLGSITNEIQQTFDLVTLPMNTLVSVGLLRQTGGAVIVDNQDENNTVFHQPIEYRVFTTT